MMLTFNRDRNIIATDVFEKAAPHVTAHGGPWVRVSDNRVWGTFLWTDMSPDTYFGEVNTDYASYVKVRLFGDIDPDGTGDLDYITGQVRPTGFATGADVLDITDGPFSGDLVPFNIVELTRVKVDPEVPTTGTKDFSDSLVSSAWMGKATAVDPANSEWSELVIMPHFLPGGGIVWNDSMEDRLPHGTGFGDWKTTGDGNSVEMIGIIQKFDVTAANSFGGMIKVKYTGTVDSEDPNVMTGQV